VIGRYSYTRTRRRRDFQLKPVKRIISKKKKRVSAISFDADRVVTAVPFSKRLTAALFSVIDNKEKPMSEDPSAFLYLSSLFFA
jgi:hypothetical protein